MRRAGRPQLVRDSERRISFTHPIAFRSRRVPDRSRRLLKPAFLLLGLLLSACRQAADPQLANNPAVARGPVLYLVLIAFAILFLALAVLAGRKLPGGYDVALRVSLPHLAGLWAPIVVSVALLYIFAAIGLMGDLAVIQASPEDAELSNPRWLVIILWLVGLWELLQLGRHLAGLYMAGRPAPSFNQTRVLALTVVGLGAFYVIVTNPLSALLLLPTSLWLFIGRRSGPGRLLDWALFLAGVMAVYGLAYVFGFPAPQIDLSVLWYLMVMLAIRAVPFPTVLVLVAILAAGLSLVVKPPAARRPS